MSLLLALITAGGPQSYSYTASGGITLSGVGQFAKGKQLSAAGGILLSGAASVSFVGVQHFTYTASGGILLSGSAPAARVFTVAASGILQLGGTSIKVAAVAWTPSGGLNMSGTAGYSTHESMRIVDAAGGLLLSGVAEMSSGGANSGVDGAPIWTQRIWR